MISTFLRKDLDGNGSYQITQEIYEEMDLFFKRNLRFCVEKDRINHVD